MRESYEDPPSSSRFGRTGGEIVEVQGGHIMRATGKKDRHSKVCTAKGPRDRRVRLAAHTAIQFYDVQDRLGYDRPSKAVDWLIKKAKAAIDELAELPAWHPTASAPENAQKKREDDEHHNIRQSVLGAQNEQMSSFLPPSLDSDAIADTIKSFFPTGSAGESSSSAMEFHNFSTTHNNSQDLRLSLQSFQDPILLHHHHYPPPPPPHTNPNHPHHSEQARAAQGQQQQQQPVLLSGIPLGFDGWPPPPPWNSGGDPTSAAGTSFQFNSPPPPQLFGSGQFFTSQQRGPLQSSNTPSLRAWMDPSPAITISMADHHHHHLPVYPSSAFGPGYGGYSGFQIPARIQGDEEEHDGYSDKPSSASSDSRH